MARVRVIAMSTRAAIGLLVLSLVSANLTGCSETVPTQLTSSELRSGLLGGKFLNSSESWWLVSESSESYLLEHRKGSEARSFNVSKQFVRIFPSRQKQLPTSLYIGDVTLLPEPGVREREERLSIESR